nr:hypothetical protein [Tanacetum cinerariifolium]
MWEDFVYQVEHKNSKKSNEMYYPLFTKVIIHHFLSKDPSILRRNKVNWHYVRDNYMFSTIKLVSGHQNMQQFDALLPTELTNEEIRNSNAYKEYYAIATGVAPPKPKASVWRTRSSSDTSIAPPTTAADEGTGSIPGVPDVPTDESEQELSSNSTVDEGDADEGKDGDGDEEDDENDDAEESGDDEQEYDEEESNEETRDEESFDPILKTPKNSDDEGMESIFETTSQMDVQTPTSAAPLPITAPTMTPSTIATISTTSQALVEAYESDKIILDTYRETIKLKRHHDDDADKEEEPSAKPDQGSKRRKEGKEPESARALTKTATRSAGRLVPSTMWIEEPICYDKHALWGVSHWGRKRQQFYDFAVNWESARDVYSKRRIIAVSELKIVDLHSYKYLD